jgi:hypothetical protein
MNWMDGRMAELLRDTPQFEVDEPSLESQVWDRIRAVASTVPMTIETMADMGMPLSDEDRAHLAQRDAERAAWEARVAARPIGLKVRLRLRADARLWSDRLGLAWDAVRGKHECGESW